MYEYNRANPDGPYGSDYEIISTDVVVFRDDQYEFLEFPFQASFITSPAPEAVSLLRFAKDEAVLQKIHDTNVHRIERIIVSAITRGFRSIVLGAYGCGAFRNDPNDIAAIFRDLLVAKGLRRFFEKVTFAIFDLPQQNWPVFQRVLGGDVGPAAA
jgi:uncharacterized protein (TIGR02452 family)